MRSSFYKGQKLLATSNHDGRPGASIAALVPDKIVLLATLAQAFSIKNFQKIVHLHHAPLLYCADTFIGENC
jgi:hypothetical protein